MKKLFAGLLLSLMLLSILSIPVLAASAFPFEEFKQDGWFMKVKTSDLSAKESFPQGYMLDGSAEYTGWNADSSRSHPLYIQSANVKFRLPDKLYDGAGQFWGDKYEASWDKLYDEHTTYRNAYNQPVRKTNAIGYHYSVGASVSMLAVEGKNTKEESAAAAAEAQKTEWEELIAREGTDIYDYSVSTEPVENGIAVILSKKRTVEYDQDDEITLDLTVSGHYIEELEEVLEYVFFYAPELEDIYFKIFCSERNSYLHDIEDSGYGDYESYISEYRAQWEELKSNDFVRQLRSWRSFFETSWEEPEISPAYHAAETKTTEEPGNIHSGTTHEAGEDPGEDEGVSVPAAIVIGVLGAGAAIAGAAAASGGDGDDGDGKRSTYKMYVQKDFGDAIRRGADKPSVIRARMAEVTANGAEHDRDDLTAMISVSGEGMNIESAVLSGRYVEAMVRVPEEYSEDSASIMFTFNGEGGTFENKVVFRVVDGPRLRFMEETPEGYVPYHENCGINAIPGDGFTYTRLFMIEDATKTPSIDDISAVDTGEFDVSFEPTGTPTVYKMHVRNNTSAQPEHDLFARASEKNFDIRVNVEGESKPVLGHVGVSLYPEGITIASDQEGKKNDVKYVRVRAHEKDHVGDLDKKWQVSQIKFTLAVKGGDKAIVDPHEAKYSFEKLRGSGGLGMRADKEQALAEKYEYKEAWGEWNDKFVYEFEPNANLAEPEDGTFFMVILPASAEYDGKTYRAEIPLRLRGKDPDPMGDWEKEYKELERRIEKFSLPENKDMWLEKMKECATDPRVSVEELRLVSKWILREYMAYWTTQQSRDRAEATMYNVIVNVLEWTKFAGDCAFSFLITAYAGPVADALLSPVKDFAAGAIGEVIAAVNNGESLDMSIMERFEFSKNLAAAGDNLVSNAIDLTNWKKAAATLGGYFVYCAMKNYLLKLNEKGESDIWGSLCDAFKDMTGAALKSKAGELIGKWLKNSKTFQEKIGPKIASYFKETSFDTLQKKLNDSLDLHGDLRKIAGYSNDKVFEAKVIDVVEKYINGLVGQGFDKVREAYDSSKFVIEDGFVYYCFTLHLFDALHYGIKLNLTRILQAMSGDFFGWFYDYFFAGIPAAESVVEVPKDPKLPAAVS